MTTSTPLETIQNLDQLYQRGFRDPVTDAAVLKIAVSQIARDEATLRDLERDLLELEQQYQITSMEFFQHWSAGEMADTADFMDWNALYQMVQEIHGRLKLLRSEH